MKIVAVIPARMAASRFPGKPLAKILDLPMIEHVRRRAKMCSLLDEVVVATCDQQILEVVEQSGGRAVMTKDTHQRCTDRVHEAMGQVSGDIVVVLQGDEPLFDQEVINNLLQPLLNDPAILCANVLTPISDLQDLKDPDIVKSLVDQQGDVLYFSRAIVPFQRVAINAPVYRQTGLSAFRVDFLNIFSNLTSTPLEITESIDFMRILEHGFSIRAVICAQRSVGVDRPDDVGIIEKLLEQDDKQRGIYQRILTLR